MNDFISTIRLLSAFQALFLFFALFLKRKNRIANRFLSLILLCYFIDLTEQHLAASGFYTPFAEYQLAIIPYAYVFGPAFYLYTAFMTSRLTRVTRGVLLYFLPLSIALALNIFSYFYFSIPARSAGTAIPLAGVTINYLINGGGILFETTLYILASFHLHLYVKKLKEYFSRIDRLQMTWLRITLAVIIPVEIAINSSYLMSAGGSHAFRTLDIFALLGGFLMLFTVAFLAITQPEIFNRIKIMKETIRENNLPGAPRYEKHRLHEETERQYAQRLMDYMEREKPYLQEDITLKELAAGLSITPHHLTMILNIHMQQSFYNFINGYRVNEVKMKLADPERDHLNILAIAMESGFNSKSSFNSIFKGITRETPREYRARFHKNRTEKN